MNRNLYLIGYRGTGKSTVGRILARRIGVPFTDMDEEIEVEAGVSIAEIFTKEGEAGFREREASQLVKQTSPPSPLSEAERGGKISRIIATGGGIILREANRSILQSSGYTVWLQASAEILWLRIAADSTTAARRPNLLGGGPAEVAELLARRESYYRSVADAAVDVGDRSPEAVADAILSLPGIPI